MCLSVRTETKKLQKLTLVDVWNMCYFQRENTNDYIMVTFDLMFDLESTPSLKSVNLSFPDLKPFTARRTATNFPLLSYYVVLCTMNRNLLILSLTY